MVGDGAVGAEGAIAADTVMGSAGGCVLHSSFGTNDVHLTSPHGNAPGRRRHSSSRGLYRLIVAEDLLVY